MTNHLLRVGPRLLLYIGAACMLIGPEPGRRSSLHCTGGIRLMMMIPKMLCHLALPRSAKSHHALRLTRPVKRLNYRRCNCWNECLLCICSSSIQLNGSDMLNEYVLPINKLPSQLPTDISICIETTKISYKKSQCYGVFNIRPCYYQHCRRRRKAKGQTKHV